MVLDIIEYVVVVSVIRKFYIDPIRGCLIHLSLSLSICLCLLDIFQSI